MLLAGCGDERVDWKLRDVENVIADLEFRLQRAGDREVVTEQASSGRIRVLFFGFTHCPDICPMTLAKLNQVMKALGDKAQQVQVLFVSVDPNRDTPQQLERYTKEFNPSFRGLTAEESYLRDLVKRYNVTFSYGDGYPDGDYTVTHSSGIFVFDREGHARLLGGTDTPIDDLTADLDKLISMTQAQ